MISIVRDSLQSEPIKLAVDSLKILLHQDQTTKFPVEIISMIIALLAVFMGPITQMWIAKRQFKEQSDLATIQLNSQKDLAIKEINASVLSANRQQWINTLRENVSEFTSFVITMSGLLQLKEVDEKTKLEKLDRGLILLSKIQLLVNPNEADHKLLVDRCEEIMTLITTYKFAEIRKKEKVIISLTQDILKKEWTRVKKLE